MKYFAATLLGVLFLAPMSVVSALSLSDSGVIDIDANVSATPTATSTDAATFGNTDSAQAETNVSISADADAVTLVTRANAGTSGTTTVSTPSAVLTQADLSAYASGLIRADVDMGDAQLSDTAVSLGYKEPAQLFGFIPVFVQATATVNAGGQTSVSYPWYILFATTDSASLLSDVKAATATNAGGGATLSASAQAQLLAQLHDAMKTHLQTALDAEAQASSVQ